MIAKFIFRSLLFSTVLVNCVGKHKLPPPNILWITSEDNSKHYLKLFDERGASTPNIEWMSKNGLVFNHAFANGPVCSVARSALISGCYGPRIGTQFHRKYHPVPMPDSLKMFPYYLREAGYYTSNNAKKDYNLIETPRTWDESSRKASWKNRHPNQPFFHVSNIGITHESSLHFSQNEMDSISKDTNLEKSSIQPNHPNTEIFAFTNAYYKSKVQEMDEKVGKIINELQAEGLMENTFIFYFGDHGGALPGSKGYLYETGLHVPLVLYIPMNYKHLVKVKRGSRTNQFVSFVDFGPTVLSLAGISVPPGLDGKPFLNVKKTTNKGSKSQHAFGYADRFDEKFDLVRSVRKGRYKYIRNFHPFNFDGLMNLYRYKQLAYQEWQDLYTEKQLNEKQSAFFRTKAPEMLFDLEVDPYETTNLAKSDSLQSILVAMRTTLNSWIVEMPDLSFFPEHHLIEHAISNPAIFGQLHKPEISKYLSIANMELSDFDQVKDALGLSLQASDPWERYWALIVCTAHAQKLPDFKSIITSITQNDSELINRIRGFEFLAFTYGIDPCKQMTECLYESTKPSEALLILNSFALMHAKGYRFNIMFDRIGKNVKGDQQVLARLSYLGTI